MKKSTLFIAFIFCLHILFAQTDTVYITKDVALKYKEVEDAFPVPSGYSIAGYAICLGIDILGNTRDMSHPMIKNFITKAIPGSQMTISYSMPSKLRKGKTVSIQRLFIFK